ncbi:hypothetical protein HMPREF1982_04427 [Clostridiales bacterium oral taxon 876 str. F0540]|nr:hypothetical protein HMPREF1982_04427 [Clostridiales bacterium oral taxon 876 str. F0540]
MNATVLNTIIRTFGVYVIALLLTRMMERKVISKMTFFDFVVGVSMGAIAANAMISSDEKAVTSLIALITLTILSVATSILHIKSFRVRKLINSEPVTLVENGSIVEENLRKIRLTVDELMMKLREKNAFNLADVEFAIMETDGMLSVLPKSDKKPLTPANMNINTISTGLTKDIIMDGTLIEENLKQAGLDRKWIEGELKKQNIKSISEVFYAGMDNNKKLYISKKHYGKEEEHGKYGIE